MKLFANSISLTIQLFCITPILFKSYPQHVDKFVKELDSSFYFLK
ncbi:glutamyl-tRNA(Gln) amidotransferase subunit C [Streptococcus sanguinis SK49]|uniref:Glutamyl-tRNA(Gln) amidotransferase subunit C n=1 Tax=Streptococcus sanguinis SK49 TaxID=888808 RepID=F3UUN0_STRSA|nr:glutamyl-tRNA(Gln) amidotransferase subunit C [Streptococcus sanguinis SK49]